MIQPTEEVISAVQNLKRSNPESYQKFGEWLATNTMAGALELSEIRDTNELLRAAGRVQAFKLINLYFNGSDEAIAKVERYRKEAQKMSDVNR